MKSIEKLLPAIFILIMGSTGLNAQNSSVLEAKANFYWSWTPGPNIGLLNASTGNFNSVQWDMGDGTILNSTPDTDYTYQNPGEYLVTLTVTNSVTGFSDSDSFPVIVGDNRCTAGFLSSPTATPGLTEFRAYPGWSLGPNHTLTWDFGDGTVVETYNEFDMIFTTHQYENPDQTYTVTLTLEYSNCLGTYSAVVNPGATGSCFASFDFEAVSEDGMTIQFTDNSITSSNSEPEDVFWDFGGGTIIPTSDEINPTVLFYDNGSYDISYSIYDEESQCSNSYIQTIVIDANPPLRANFSYAYPAFNSDEVDLYLFTNFSGNYTSYQFDMGNGEILTDIGDGTYAYDAEGDYEICATVFNEINGEEAFFCLPFSTNPDCPVFFTSYNLDDEGTVIFKATYPSFFQPYLSYEWDFGDGTPLVSTENPTIVHEFDQSSALYNVTVTMTSADAFGNVNCVGSFNHFVEIPQLLLSLNDFEASNEITAYPNPSGGMVTVELTSESPFSEIRVIDLTGKVVFYDRIAVNQGLTTRFDMDLANLSNGFYTLIVEDAYQQSSMQIIIQK